MEHEEHAIKRYEQYIKLHHIMKCGQIRSDEMRLLRLR